MITRPPTSPTPAAPRARTAPWMPALALLLLALPPALAQQIPGVPISRDTSHLAPVVVTGTRDSVTQVAPTASTTVITGASLRSQGIVTVQEALNVVSSITTVQAGSFGATTSLFTRGGQSDYTLVLVDGAPVNDPGGFANLAALTTDNVDRIEVVRGPGSVLYGSDAVTGIVQIFTRSGAAGEFAGLAASAGSYGTRDYDLTFGLGKPDASITFAGARYRTTGISFNNAFGNDVYSIAGHLGTPGASHLEFAARQMTTNFDYPTDYTGAAVDSNQYTDGRLRLASLDGGVFLGRKLEIAARAGWTQNKSTSANLPDNPGDSTGFYYVDPSTLEQWNVDAHLALHLNPSTVLTGGGAYISQQERASDSSWTSISVDTSSSDHSRHNTAYYLNATGDLGKHFTYNAGIRWTDSPLFGNFNTYQVGAGILLGKGTFFRGSLGTAFREPSFYEEYAAGFAMGNPYLNPEHGSSWEAGFTQRFGKGDVELGVTYFSQKFTDMIQYDPSVPPGTPNYANIGEATASGWEASFHALMGVQWLFDAQYTWLKTDVVNAGAGAGPAADLIEGQPLLRRPANAGNASLTYHVPKKLALSVQAVYVGSREDIDYVAYARVTMPSYTLWNASMLYTIRGDKEGRYLGITLRGTNLLNPGYQQTVNFAAPGRVLLVGLRLGMGE
ncbi:MAG TPA: TonB-dependent receptor [Gemmatimonadaceae bacterium]|nr:TonB-dependent receptor [Gemmatimonadaceae bacterium]